MKKKKGLFIVLDGTDGSGKATQAGLLIKRLREKDYKVEQIDFPQYGKKSAVLVEEYLNGKYGKAREVGPYRASVFYACDRYVASARIEKWLKDGRIVICNRYVTANMGHQGGKIKDGKERKKFFKWLYDLEYNIFSVPKPDINLILHVNIAVAQKMIDLKKKRNYLKGKEKDIHESDLGHLRDAEKAYLEITRIFPDISLIECMSKGKIMSREKINDIIWSKLKRRLAR
jgi:dTMP kinase